VAACGKHCLAPKRQAPYGPCTQPAGHGTDHAGIGACSSHLGNTPNHRKAANAVKAERAVAKFALPVETTHEAALLENLWRWTGMVQFLAGKITGFESDDELKQLSVGVGREKFERQSVWVEMYQTALREQRTSAKVCADVGINERMTNLAERHGQMLDGVIRALVTAMMARLVALGLPEAAVRAFERDELPALVRAAVFAVIPPDELRGGTAA
jgi:hypothetical protein